jgi:regulator of protease activity HflC (stomatin/prohibitin superfamily)
MTTNDLTKGWFNPISFSVLLILLGVSAVLYVLQIVNIPILASLLLFSGLFASAIRIADQWERAVVLRMGKFKGLRGPGPFLIIPILDSVATFIDQRVRVSAFKAEQTLSKDTVPVNVDAVVYWTVWDVEKAALEVQNYIKAIEHIAQTGLRDTIGKHELSELLQDRDKIAEDLQLVLDKNTNPWGITCQTVGIKDIVIPQALADSMSKEAQAERERRARVILGTAETEIAEKFEQASKKYTNNPVALHLRG